MDHYERSSQNSFTTASIDRMTHKRRDERWIAEQLKGKTTRFIPLWRSQNLFTNQGDLRPVFPDALDLGDLIETAETLIFLGTKDDEVYVAVDLPAHDPTVPERFAGFGNFYDLRKVGALIDRDHGALLAYARGITAWHRRHRFCGDCGGRTTSTEGGHILVCTNEQCGRQHFPRTDPAIIVLITSGERCLLGRQTIWEKGRYSTIAGFVEPGESLEAAVLREVWEETGIHLTEVFYYSSQPWPFPSSIMVRFTAQAAHEEIRIEGDELEDARWFSRNDIRNGLGNGTLSLPFPFSIAYRLIEDWFDAGNCGRLAHITNTTS